MLITIIFGRASQFILALVMMRIATTLLSPQEMGKVSLVVTTTAFFALFLVNPVGMFINRKLHAWFATGVAKYYLIQYLNYLFFVAVFASIFLSVLFATGEINFGLTVWWLIVLVSGSLIFNTINQTAIPSLNLLGESEKFIYFTVATILASLICALILVTYVESSAGFWLLGILSGQIIFAFVGTIFLFRKLGQKNCTFGTIKISGAHLKTLSKFAWPVAIAAGLGWLQSQGYRYLIQGQLGFYELGLFVAGYGVSAGIIAGFESILTTYFQPRLYRDVSHSNALQQKMAWQFYANALIPSLLLTVAYVGIMAPELTRVFLGKHFQIASEYVLWGALAESMRVLIAIYSLIAHVKMQTKLLIFPNLLGALFSMGLCYLLIPICGANGAGLGLGISGFIILLTMHVMFLSKSEGLILINALFKICIFSLILWLPAIYMRFLVEQDNVFKVFFMLLVVGCLYIALQYLLLRKYIQKKASLDAN